MSKQNNYVKQNTYSGCCLCMRAEKDNNKYTIKGVHQICFMIATRHRQFPRVIGKDNSGFSDMGGDLSTMIYGNVTEFFNGTNEEDTDVEDQAIEKWAGFTGDDAVIPLTEEVPVFPVKYDDFGHADKSVLGQLSRGVPAAAVVGKPTPMKQLCIEMKAFPADSILKPLLENKYTGADAIVMGVTRSMVTGCAADWNIIMGSRFFTVPQLYKLGITFTRMLLAGMELPLFESVPFTNEELHVLRFNVAAFRAAGGTDKQLSAIIKKRDAQIENMKKANEGDDDAEMSMPAYNFGM